MPHTNRKKNPHSAKPKPHLVHTKRQQIEDSDGWTHIVDAPRHSTPAKGKDWLHAGDFEKNGASYVNRTLEEVRKDFDHYTQQWENSEACASLTKTLQDREGKVKVDHVVVLGLGSLQSARREGRRASYTQLAALRTLIPALGEGKLDCVFQDPQFTDLDHQFLETLGYTVVEDPEAFGTITGSSLVYAIHCYADVYMAVAEAPRPAMMVITDVENFGRFNVSEKMNTIAKGLEDMVKDCNAFDFPQIRQDFSDTKIYWRPEVAASKP